MGREVEDEDWAATTGSNPLQLWYWNVNIFDVASSNINIAFRVRLIYDCVFFDRIETSPSFYLKDPEKGHKKQARQDTTYEISNQVSIVTQPK